MVRHRAGYRSNQLSYETVAEGDAENAIQRCTGHDKKLPFQVLPKNVRKQRVLTNGALGLTASGVAAYLMVQNAARQTQHDVSALTHRAAMPMGAANAKSYAGMAIISSLSWAGTNALSDPVLFLHPVQHSGEGSLPARSAIQQVFQRVSSTASITPRADANGRSAYSA